MITEICPKEQCAGCAACFNICPVGCISMISDAEGFLRPVIDFEYCNDCGACKHVCPMLRTLKVNNVAVSQCYACWNRDEMIRFQSASGGVFSALAGSILDSGGVVFGAAFDKNMRLNHVAVGRKEELGRLRSSKYVQSNIGRTYIDVRECLRQNKRVLFSGTPCQVAGLYAFLGKDNKNIFTCDLVCYGVPSPGLFARYVKWLEDHFQGKLANINFRHKREGWHILSTVAFFNNGRERVLTGCGNSFMYGFLNYFSLRPACYQCPYMAIDRKGDVTLGDFWSIGALRSFHHSTRNGISLVLVNSEKGRLLFEESSGQLYFEKRTLEEAKHNKPQLSHPSPKPGNREQFFADYSRLGYKMLAEKYLVDKGIKGLIRSVVPPTWIFYLRECIKKIRPTLVQKP